MCNSTLPFFKGYGGVVHPKKCVAGWSWAPLNTPRIYILTLVHTTTHLDTHHMPWYAPLCTTTHLIRLSIHHYKPYVPWYTPVYITCLGAHYYTPYMEWYTPHALVHTTTHLICHSIHHYTPYMPWYTPLHTLLHAFVLAPAHLICLHTHHMPTYTHHYTPYICCTHYPPYMPWYTPLRTLYVFIHTLHALVHTTTTRDVALKKHV